MLKKIADGYAELFSLIGKIVLLFALCIGLGFAIVWPLWKWATTKPESYTICILLIIAGIFIITVINKLRTKSFVTLLSGFLKFIVIAGGSVCCIMLVLKGYRLFTIPVIVSMFILYGICAYGFKKSGM